ncbi:hypothetical protein [Thermococcus sp. JdF3]|uniref:hypothetical protein n=1 Tax=Thermococcus sp. JdF3 TaxID=1638258 RepID=UPI00143B191F|nr:hypothetical protein [Thermococcus sp. JdF3]NJE01287.1 hypothetical protein [Thermococcus sp. JdF3]
MIKTLGEDKVLVTIKGDNLRDDECYRDLLDDRVWFSLSLVSLSLKRIGKKIEDEFLVERAEKYFKTQISA